MNKTLLAVIIAGLGFGLSTAELDAKTHHSHRHNYMWHNGKHYHLHGNHHHHKRHHKAHHAAAAAAPVVVAHVYVGSQLMTVDVNGQRVGQWAVSTAGHGYHTPHGYFHAIRMARVYYSKKYDNSPMPNSVFFSGGNAIHGTYHIKSLGHPASHGCVRLLPQHAAELYSLVASYGMNRTRIIVSD